MSTMVKEQIPFGTAHEQELIEVGSHFYCHGHGGARPIEEQSPDPSYCQACVEKEEFNTLRDRVLIKAGTHFYCHGHLGARPIEEQSEDPRYCRSCREFLSQEAKLNHSRAAWVPKIVGKGRGKKAAAGKPHSTPITSRVPSVKGDTIPGHSTLPPANRPPIMSTSKAPPLVMVKKRRGPKQKNLPLQTIKFLAKTGGLGSKRIAARLKGQGIDVSYKTIQRILNGQRKAE